MKTFLHWVLMIAVTIMVYTRLRHAFWPVIFAVPTGVVIAGIVSTLVSVGEETVAFLRRP